MPPHRPLHAAPPASHIRANGASGRGLTTCSRSLRSLYYLLDLATGGDLYALLDIHPIFPEEWALFYTGSLALALRHMHKHCYVYRCAAPETCMQWQGVWSGMQTRRLSARRAFHRDMKPENVLLDSGGYVCLADMGFAKKVEDRTFTACGTDECAAPRTPHISVFQRLSSSVLSCANRLARPHSRPPATSSARGRVLTHAHAQRTYTRTHTRATERRRQVSRRCPSSPGTCPPSCSRARDAPRLQIGGGSGFCCMR